MPISTKAFELAPAVSRQPKPFLKWAGGKTSLLPVLRQFVPSEFNSYIEPFAGGGAMYFDLAPEKGLLVDANAELISCYRIVRDHPGELIAALETFQVSPDEFYRVRALDTKLLSSVELAARMIYLNKTCFNGLYRVNRRGEFNTPFGGYKSVRFFDGDVLFAASGALKSARLRCDSYEEALLEEAKDGDFVYLDPPYLPISQYSDFKRYTSRQFSEKDHYRLAQVFRQLDKRGCHLLMSHSFHPAILQLYQGFRIKTVEAPRSINCKGGSRGRVKELLVTNIQK